MRMSQSCGASWRMTPTSRVTSSLCGKWVTGWCSGRTAPDHASRPAAGRAATLPGAALTEFRDHLAQPLRGVAPVDQHCLLGRERVPLADGFDDGVVFTDRFRDLIHERADVQADVAFGLGLDDVVQRKQPRACASL